MSSLSDELLAISAIHSSETLVLLSSNTSSISTSSDSSQCPPEPSTTQPSICLLRLPTLPSVAFRLEFPPDYPDTPPSILGTDTVGDDLAKGAGHQLVEILRHTLAEIYTPGVPCVFDLIEDASSAISQEREEEGQVRNTDTRSSYEVGLEDGDEDAHAGSEEGNPRSRNARPSTTTTTTSSSSDEHALKEPPPWTLSEPLIVSKSTFLARVARCTSATQANAYIHHLLSRDKHVSRATHNITAYRLRGPTPGSAIQDNDDDGETAAGGRLGKLLELMDVWDVVVVVSRWYGGVKLGPARFGCINSVAREALVNGGFVKDEKGGGDGKGEGKGGRRGRR